MIDQHKAKQKRRPREELEQDANQHQPQSKLVRVISPMENGWKRQWEELEQDANQNQSQSKLVRVISSMENGRKRPWEELEQDANQNRPQWSRMRTTSPSLYLTQPLHMEELLPLKLVFPNEVRQPMYTCKTLIEIQLIDINTGRQCTNVKGLNINVKFFVINGDLELKNLDSDKFNRKIVKQREGKRALLVGNTEVAFNQQGVGTIGDIYFTDNSKWLRSGKFRLGACIDSKRCGTIIKIQEGLSEKFVVKDHRGLLCEKHYPPILAKDGKYHQRLKENNIDSGQDFLKLSYVNPCVLKEILKMPTNVFKKVVKHAQMCPMELNNAKFKNNSDLPKIPGLEPNPMPVPNAGLLHAPESQAQYMVRPISIDMVNSDANYILKTSADCNFGEIYAGNSGSVFQPPNSIRSTCSTFLF